MATMKSSVELEAVEKIVGYEFRDEALLEEALTHSSYTEAPSYQRLEFFGDAALGLAVAKYLYESNPDFNQGQLSHFREAIVSTDMLARVAVQHDLFRYLRHSCSPLESNVEKFVGVVREEGDEIMLPPKVLADIVESILAAVYIDCGYDLKRLWNCVHDLLRPLSMKILREFCQKESRDVRITLAHKKWKGVTAYVFVDGWLVGSGFSKQEDIAVTNAAEKALENLCQSLSNDDSNDVLSAEEIDNAKQKLNEFCTKKRWPKPTYRKEKEDGPAHERRFIYSVHIDTKEGPYTVLGDMKLKVKDAENSAASIMLCGLKQGRVGGAAAPGPDPGPRFGWDPVTKKFTADDEVWEEYFKSHPNHRYYQTDTFKDYEDLRIVVGNATAVGRYAMGLGGDDTDARTFEAEETDDDALEDFIYDYDVGAFIQRNEQQQEHTNQPPLSGILNAPSPIEPTISEVPSSTKKRTRTEKERNSNLGGNNSVQMDALNKLTETISNFNDKVDSFMAREQGCWKIIKENPNLDDNTRFKLLKLLNTRAKKMEFLKMSSEDRTKWIAFELME